MSENKIDVLVKELQKAVLDDPELQKFRTDESYIRRFLYFADMDIPLALTKMRDYHKLFVQNPKWFASAPPLDVKDKIEENDKTVLKERDLQGRGILIVKLGKLNTVNSSPEEHARLFELWLELLMDEHDVQAKGISVILDMLDYSWKLFRWVTPTNIIVSTKKIDLYPCKEFVFHIVNTSFLVNTTIKIVWPFLSERIKKMIKFHFEDWPSLHKYISKEVLAPEYGGTGPPLDFDKANMKLFDKNVEIGENLKRQVLI